MEPLLTELKGFQKESFFSMISIPSQGALIKLKVKLLEEIFWKQFGSISQRLKQSEVFLDKSAKDDHLIMAFSFMEQYYPLELVQ